MPAHMTILIIPSLVNLRYMYICMFFVFPSWNVGVSTTYWKAIVCVVRECVKILIRPLSVAEEPCQRDFILQKRPIRMCEDTHNAAIMTSYIIYTHKHTQTHTHIQAQSTDATATAINNAASAGVVCMCAVTAVYVYEHLEHCRGARKTRQKSE